MSPSENDLRTALRDGEGDNRPDVDGLLAHVRGRRAQRRTRVLSTAAAVVVVAAAAVGGAAVWGGSDGGGQEAARTGAPSAAIGSRPPQRGPGPVSAAPCPTAYPGRTAGVPAGTPGGQMFPEAVASVTICAYTDAALNPFSAPLVLNGANATALTDSVEHASGTRLRVMCPAIAVAQHHQLAIIGVTAGGTQLPVVTTDVSIPNCNQPITNGTAVRYAWKPPTDLAARIAALTSRGSAGSSGNTGAGLPTPTGHSGLNGSPVR